MMAMPKPSAVRRNGAVWTVCALGVFAALLLLAAPLQAEPYFTVREGYKCSKCHVNKTGGGMRTDYAKVYMSTRNSIWPGLGAMMKGEDAPKADVASSRLSRYFSINADLRADLVYTDRENEDPHYEFMRASTSQDSTAPCATCHGDSNGGGKRAELFARAEVEPDFASVVLSESLSPTVASREMYAILEALPANGYVKAGVFRLPTGVNNTFDEPFYHVNQTPGATVPTVETVRGSGLELGVEPGPFSVALSVTNPSDLTNTTKQKRVHLSAYGVTGLGIVGVTAYKDPISDNQDEIEYRSLTGGYLGINLGRATVMLEVDNLKEKLVTGQSLQRTGLAQLDFLISKGQNLKVQYEMIDPDRETEKDIRDRSSLIYEPFLTPYLQTRVGYRYYNGPAQADTTKPDANNGRQVFVELHLLY